MNSTSWIMVTCPCVINLSLWWDFTVFPTTVTDSSLALWMTPYQFSSPRVQILHIRFGWRLTFPLLWRLTLPSLWRLFSNCHSERGASMPCGKDGKRNDESEWRIYYPDDVLPASSLRQQILHIRSGWRFMVFFIMTASLRHRSGWYLTVRRQKKLLAHAVRLRILACRNDLNRKRIVSLQLTAHSW